MYRIFDPTSLKWTLYLLMYNISSSRYCTRSSYNILHSRLSTGSSVQHPLQKICMYIIFCTAFLTVDYIYMYSTLTLCTVPRTVDYVQDLLYNIPDRRLCTLSSVQHRSGNRVYMTLCRHSHGGHFVQNILYDIPGEGRIPDLYRRSPFVQTAQPEED
jgi:hypothetical protein